MAKDTLEVPEKQQDQFTYAESVKYLVEQKKAEFQAIQGKIAQYKTQVATLEQRLISLEGEHKAKLLAEKQAFERDKQQKTNELANRFSALQKNEGDYVQRKIAIEERELRVENVNREKKALLDERLKYEQLNTQAKAKFGEANNLYDEAVKKIDDASKKEADVNNKLTAIKNIKSIVNKRKEDLIAQENEIKKQADNLIALRKEIAPKIEELNKLNLESNKKIADIIQKEKEIKDRIEEDNKIMSVIEEREKRLKQKELDLATKEQELLRKEIVIKNL